MMVRIVLLCTLWFGSVAVLANENRDLLQKKGATVDVKASLISKESWIQYPAYTDRAGWDLLTGSAKKDIIELGEKYLSHEWKVIKATDYLEFERSGDRVIMQNTFNANFTALSTLIFAELSEGKGRFLDQIINGIWNACDMPSWALSAHLVTQQSRRSLPDFNEQIIDHASGDIGAMCSWTYYFLHAEFDKVNPVISRRIRKEVQDRILTPYTTRDDFFWQALKANPNTVVNNWNPWCNSNVLTCFLLIEDKRCADRSGIADHAIS